MRRTNSLIAAFTFILLLIFLSGCPMPSQPEMYTVTFNTDGGSTVNSQLVQENEKATRPAVNPTKAGYAFDNWYAEETFDTVWNFDTTIKEDTTLHAKWIAESYTVTFDSQGASTNADPASKTVTYPAATIDELPTAPKKTGYTFGGWFTEEEGDESEFSASTEVTKDLAIYAKWTAVDYTITYQLNGGTNHEENPSGYCVDDLPVVFQTPAKTGYQFDGWYTDSSFDNPIEEISKGTTGDLVIHAKWSAAEYTVTFNLQGGSTLEQMTKNVTYGMEYGALKDVSIDGYTFEGWYTKSYGTGEKVENGTLVNATADHTLYAKWIPIVYTVTFDALDGDTSNPASKTVTYGQPYNTLATTKRDGYIFEGWYTEENGTGALVDCTTIVNTSSHHTLYAKWTASYTVTLDSQGGNDINAVEVARYTGLVEPSCPEREGYIFGGWYQESECINAWDFDKDVVQSNMTLYARWYITRPELERKIGNNEDVTGVDTALITDMSDLINKSWFNQDISGWDVSNVTDMSYMFTQRGYFNRDISGWDVSNVTDMSFMFYAAKRFNQDISNWDVSNVTKMRRMFTGADAFNGDISSWDVSEVVNMEGMFASAKSFNQDISSWDVSSVTDMDGMFHYATSFNQNISGWDVSNVYFGWGSSFSVNCPLLTEYHPDPSWDD